MIDLLPVAAVLGPGVLAGAAVLYHRHGGVKLYPQRTDFPLIRAVSALPIPDQVNLDALPVGMGQFGPWNLRLRGTHVLIAGATGAGKGSVLWSIVRACQPAVQAGLVELWGLDPKRVELAYGRGLFSEYADTAEGCAELLEYAVEKLRGRTDAMQGLTREHTPAAGDPHRVIFVDEVADLTAYCPDKKIRQRVSAALAVLTSQGRAPGFSVVAALQDPRKDILDIRDLFPLRIAMRLETKNQVDMALGEGAYENGARPNEIPDDPSAAGHAFVKVQGTRAPQLVRAAFVGNDDIKAMEARYGRLRPVQAA